MSISVTVTQTAAPQPAIALNLRVRTPAETRKDEVASLIKAMVASRIFDSRYEALLSALEKQFCAGMGNLANDEERYDAADSICSIIVQVIRPIMCATQNEKLVAYEDSFLEVLKKVLPPRENAEAFLERFDDDCFNEALASQKKACIDEQTDKQLDAIVDLANASIGKVEVAHRVLLERISKLNLLGKENAKEAEQKLNATAAKTKAAFSKQAGLATQVKSVGDKAQSQITADKKLIQNGMNVN